MSERGRRTKRQLNAATYAEAVRHARAPMMAKRKNFLLNIAEILVLGGKESVSGCLSESGAESAKCRRRLRACK